VVARFGSENNLEVYSICPQCRAATEREEEE
jgi:hypothetical protein